MNKYVIFAYKTNTGYSAHCPDVDGCVATGDTREECVQNMAEALEFHFEGMQEDGEPIPQPEALVDYVEVGRLTVAIPTAIKGS
jgi:predicted RNase H-like HicB family nuclease